ncbi:hypothetical protein GQ53DRAFT_871485 [Thozetella sp. PMI_491]|nr:hypothetical protein GQ53DRAFT_871485 [Thozetella sp. PMI_491]
MSSLVSSVAQAYASASKRPYAGVASGLLLYLILVRALRFRRANSWKKKYGFTTRSSLSQMTIEQAHKINQELASQEFPLTFATSLFFALFKTYGIPSISRLLLATNQLGSEKTVSKRAADTTAIMAEIMSGEPASERHLDGLARVNYLHSRYRQAGKITDGDMLYTLSLFALEPVRWTAKLEWRTLNETEKCALGVFWRDVGTSMEIPYDALKPHIKDAYDDGLTWLNALDQWSIEYEEKYMVPAPSNEQVANSTLYLGFYNIPKPLKPLFIRLTSVVLEPRLRKAVMIPEPTLINRVYMNGYNNIRKYVLLYLCLPRPYALRRKTVSEVDPKTGKIYLEQYVGHPWYVKPTFAARWGPDAWFKRLLGGYIPGDDGAKYFPDGYHIRDVGPDYHKGKGAEEMAKDKERLVELRKASGCPMTAALNGVKH